MTIVILGILSVTALPKFFSLSVFQQQVFFDDTLNALRYAQKLAVVTACNVQVSIAANTFTIYTSGRHRSQQLHIDYRRRFYPKRDQTRFP